MQFAINNQENDTLVDGKFVVTMLLHTQPNLCSIFESKRYMPRICGPPYSPDMGSCDILLFLQIKNTFSKGKQYEDVEMIKFNTTQQLLEIPAVYFEGCVQ